MVSIFLFGLNGSFLQVCFCPCFASNFKLQDTAVS